MPRVCASNNDPHDFFLKCFPPYSKAKAGFGDCGDGPDCRGDCFEYDASHPDYDGEDYKCLACRVTLTSRDNDALPM